MVTLFFDLSRTTDIVDTKLLLRTIYYLGVRYVPYNWFHSYILNGSQKVVINNCYKFSKEEVKIGIQQGSVFGHFHF